MPLPRAYRPDVVIPLDDEPARWRDRGARVLEYAGPVMGRLVHQRRVWSITRPARKPRSPNQMITSLSSKAVLEGPCVPRGFDGLLLADLVLLNSRYHPPSGWLDELAEVAHAEERTACVSPLVEMSETWLAARTKFELSSGESSSTRPRACAHLPRWTTTPEASPACVYLRRGNRGRRPVRSELFG